MNAGLLVDPAQGSSVGFPSNADDEAVTRNLGGTFSLYGSSITNINVSVNGFLGTTDISGVFADRSIGELAAHVGGPVIAGMYDDLSFGAGSNVVDQSVANTYYAVTYESLFGNGDVTPGHITDLQILLIMANTTIDGFNFQQGDIAIGYGQLLHTIRDTTATVGVGDGFGFFTGNNTTADGSLTSLNGLPTGNRFLLYRPVIVNDDEETAITYNVSVEATATPEPATFLISAIGIAAVALLKRRF